MQSALVRKDVRYVEENIKLSYVMNLKEKRKPSNNTACSEVTGQKLLNEQHSSTSIPEDLRQIKDKLAYLCFEKPDDGFVDGRRCSNSTL